MKLEFRMHSLRATSSTVANENGFNRNCIEIQLIYIPDNKTRTSYNHAQGLSDTMVG